ncbi:response regulator transcription factor [Desulfobacterales bacterium HSG17]|nr:response regulator transcription factor [Desulfobacterales bacterium HSG17]
MHPYRIMLADDHIMLRSGIRKIIEDFKDMDIVGEVGDGLELLNMLKKVLTDMIILDISMPNLRGIEATREIKSNHPDIKILILSMHKSKEYLYQAISAGAEGYLLKDDSDRELLTAINTIRNDNIYLSPNLSRDLTHDFIETCRGGNKPLDDPLTAREKQVLKLIAEGNTCKNISSLLYISIRTAQHHRASILKKLNIKKMPELVKYAINKGYIASHE